MTTLKIVPDRLDIVICPGAALNLQGSFDDVPDDCDAVPTPVDVAGWSGDIRFKASPTATDSIASFPLTFGTGGSVVIAVSAAAINALPDSVKGFDIIGRDSNGAVIPMAFGSFRRAYE